MAYVFSVEFEDSSTTGPFDTYYVVATSAVIATQLAQEAAEGTHILSVTREYEVDAIEEGL